MTAKEFCIEHGACSAGREWVQSVGLMESPILEVWKRPDLDHEWRVWILTRPGVASDHDLRLFACNCVRQFWDLVSPEGKHAVEVAERFANGLATSKELEHAQDIAINIKEGSSWIKSTVIWTTNRRLTTLPGILPVGLRIVHARSN